MIQEKLLEQTTFNILSMNTRGTDSKVLYQNLSLVDARSNYKSLCMSIDPFTTVLVVRSPNFSGDITL